VIHLGGLREWRTGCRARARGGVGQLVESGGVKIEQGRAVARDSMSRGRVVVLNVAVLMVGQRLGDR